MNVNQNKMFGGILAICVISLLLAIVQMINTHQMEAPAFLGFISFIAAFVFLVIIVIILIDILGKSKEVIQAKVVHTEKKFVHVLRTDGQLKKYKIVDAELLDHLQADQQVEITLTKWTQVPIRISLDTNGEKATA